MKSYYSDEIGRVYIADDVDAEIAEKDKQIKQMKKIIDIERNAHISNRDKLVQARTILCTIYKDL